MKADIPTLPSITAAQNLWKRRCPGVRKNNGYSEGDYFIRMRLLGKVFGVLGSFQLVHDSSIETNNNPGNMIFFTGVLNSIPNWVVCLSVLIYNAWWPDKTMFFYISWLVGFSFLKYLSKIQYTGLWGMNACLSCHNSEWIEIYSNSRNRQ